MPSSRGFPNPGIKPKSLMSLALAGRFFTTNATWEAQINYISIKKKKKCLMAISPCVYWPQSRPLRDVSHPLGAAMKPQGTSPMRLTLSERNVLRKRKKEMAGK